MEVQGGSCGVPQWDEMDVDEETTMATSTPFSAVCSSSELPRAPQPSYLGSAPAVRAAMVVGSCNSGGNLKRDGGAAAVYEEPEPARSGAVTGAPNKKASLRRSFSHSNLHDRSASLDRPSVIQCIKAIGFIFEHMAREDSYRERSRGFDFSAPGAGNSRMDWEDEDMGGGMGESGVSGEEVSGFLDSLYCLCKWTPECNIMALILIIRLFQYNQDLTLHEGNWKRLLLTALMIAQKTWDDRALMNKDFPVIWSAVAGTGESPMNLEEVNELEREFFRRLDHHLFIAPAMYASTYFELCSLVPSDEAIKNQLHQLIQVAGANVRVVQSQKADVSFSYNTAEVIYSPNVPAPNGGAVRAAKDNQQSQPQTTAGRGFYGGWFG